MKTRAMRLLLAIIVLFSVFTFTGCGNEVRNIPPGYVGKVLTPTGWEDKIREAGQVDIGQLNNDGTGNSLVLLEVTSVTIKEQFMKGNNDGEDHRILVGGSTPVSVDIYTQAGIPLHKDGKLDEKFINIIFSQVTPRAVQGQERTMVITLQDVYDRFAKMNIRSNTRSIFAEYNSYTDVMKSFGKVSDRIGAMVTTVFKQNNVPLAISSCNLSNVKPDETVWAASNRQAAADAEVASINKVGDAMRNNPGYLKFKELETLRDLGNSGRIQNLTVIMDQTGKGVQYTAPVVK